jgi:hypothetical protein
MSDEILNSEMEGKKKYVKICLRFSSFKLQVYKCMIHVTSHLSDSKNTTSQTEVETNSQTLPLNKFFILLIQKKFHID